LRPVPTKFLPETNVENETACASKTRAVTLRVISLSVLLAAFFGYIEPCIDLKFSNTFLGATHFPPGAVGVLLLLVLVVSPLLRLAGKRFAFSRNELLTIYIACLFSCLVPGHGAENFFVACLIAPFYFSNPENKWLEFLLPNLKQWFSPALMDGYNAAGKDAAAQWFLGNGGAVPWQIWLVPLAAWSALILVSYAMLACLAVMLRAQWSDNEALAFPLLKFPLAMTEENATGGIAPIFRDRFFWCGAALAGFIQLANGLHFYFPDAPKIALFINSAPLLSEAPWNQIGDVPLIVWPIAVGITFFISSEIALSLWAFYWLTKLQFILLWALGYPPQTLPRIPGFSGIPAFMSYARIGAFFAYVGWLFWIGREHWQLILRRAFGRAGSTPGEREEALSYPVAFWGFCICFVFILLWCLCAGIRLEVALGLWISYLVIAVALTRLVAEGGVLLAQHQWMPLGAMSQLFGANFLPTSSLVPASFVQTAMVHDLRGFLLPSFVQSFKLARDEKIPLRPLLGLIAVVTVIAFAVGIWMRVRLGYEVGGLQMNPWAAIAGPKWPPRVVTAIESAPVAASFWESFLNWLWLGSGAVFTLVLLLLRARFAGFPLHPLGYLITLTFALDQLWVSIFIGWLCKTLAQRFGGHETAKRIAPFFIGLVLGDIALMLFWLGVDSWQGAHLHQLMPD
jgi:hypothetical protein